MKLMGCFHYRQTDVHSCIQKEINWRFPIRGLRRCVVQCNAMDLLCLHQDWWIPSDHHQFVRVCHWDHLHHHVPRLRPEENQGLHRKSHIVLECGSVLVDCSLHSATYQGPKPCETLGLALRGLCSERLRSPFEHNRKKHTHIHADM